MWRNIRGFSFTGLAACAAAAGVLVYGASATAQSNQGAGGVSQGQGGASGQGGTTGGRAAAAGGFPQRPMMQQPVQPGFGLGGQTQGQFQGQDQFGNQGAFDTRSRFNGTARDRRGRFDTDTQFDNNRRTFNRDRTQSQRNRRDRFEPDTDFNRDAFDSGDFDGNGRTFSGINRRSRFSQESRSQDSRRDEGTFGDFIAERAGRGDRDRFGRDFNDGFSDSFDDRFDRRFDDRFDEQFDERFDDRFADDFDDFDELDVLDEQDLGGRNPGFRDSRRNFANSRARDIRNDDGFDDFGDDFGDDFDELDRRDERLSAAARFRGQVRSSLGLDFARGDGSSLTLSGIASGGAAAEAGLQEGDHIVSVNGREVDSFGDFVSQLRTGRTGDPLEVVVNRDGQQETLNLALPDDFFQQGDDIREFDRRVSGEARGRALSGRQRSDGRFDEDLDGRFSNRVGDRFDDRADRFDNGELDRGDVRLPDSAGFRGQVRSSLGLDFARGDGSSLTLSGIASGSVAAEAGLEQGDEIVSVNGSDIDNFGDFVSLLRTGRTGDPLEVVVNRDGQQQTINLALPDDFFQQRGDIGEFDGRVSGEARGRALSDRRPFEDRLDERFDERVGDRLDNGELDRRDGRLPDSAGFRGQVRSSLGLDFARGDGSSLTLSGIASGSVAAEAGLEQGDEIVSVNGSDIDNFGDFVSLLRTGRTGDPLEVVVNRDGQQQTISLALPDDFFQQRDDIREFNTRVNREARQRTPSGRPRFEERFDDRFEGRFEDDFR